MEVDGKLFTLTFDKGSNKNNGPKYYTSGTAARFYGGNTITVTVLEGYKITSIEIATTSAGNANVITSDVGSCDDAGQGQTVTWAGEISNGGSVTFTVSGTSGHRRISSIKID